MITQASWVPPQLGRLPAGPPSMPSLVGLSGEFGQVEGVDGVWDDVQALASKAPQVISQVVTLIKKAESHLPAIIRIVDKTGKYLPDVLKAIEKVGPYLPKVLKILDKAAPHLPKIIATIENNEDVIIAVIEDPALPQVIERVRAIIALEKTIKAKKGAGLGQAATTTAASTKVGVGLKRLVPALDFYLYARANPWLPWVAGSGVVLLLFGLGFGVGRLTTRRREAKAVAGAVHYQMRSAAVTGRQASS